MRSKQFTSSRLRRFIALASLAVAAAVAITGQAMATTSPYPPDKSVAHVYQRLQNRPTVSLFKLRTLTARLAAMTQMYACDSGTTQYPSDVLGHCEYVSPSASWNDSAP